MVFESVALNNFMSFKEAVFPFEHGLILLDGPNGVGKSSVWDGVSWTLFGKTIREVEGDEVVHWKFGENCVGVTKFQAHGHKYEVVRHRKHEEFKNRLWVVKDGKHVEKGTNDLTQSWLIEEMGVDFELFRCTVLFGQDAQFNFVDESNAEQKKILSKIMRVNFTSYQQKAKDELKTVAQRQVELDRKLGILRSHLEDPEKKYQREIAEWEERQKDKQYDLKEQIKEISASIEANEKLVAGRDLAELGGKLAKANEKIAESEARIEDRRKTVTSLSARVMSIEKDISRHEKLLESGNCPTCEEPVKTGKCEKLLEKLTESLVAAQDKRNSYLGAIESDRLLIEKLEPKRDRIQEVIDEVTEAAEALTQDKKTFRHRKTELAQLESEAHPFTGRIAEEKEKQAEIKAKIKEFEKETKALKEREPYLEFWVKAFGDDGIKSFIFDVICAGLTMKANSYLNTLTDGKISVSFDTQKKLKSGELRDKFDCQVVTCGHQVAYHRYSGGEKRRISLAVDMALSDIMSDQYGSKFNVVVFDEQTNYLDPKGRSGFMRLLKDLSKTKAVYVVDHDAQFKAEFDEVITIEKKGEVSRIC